MLPIKFKDANHHEAFEELLDQVDFNVDQLKDRTPLLKRQMAFIYLIAMYQEDYEIYEGCKFYLEEYEELSIDGPVYLLEDEITLDNYPHEKMLQVAKNLLRQEPISREQIEQELQLFIDEALKMIQ